MNMWMVGYNEGGDFNMADYAFNGRKLRPLMPRPVTTTTSPNNTSTPTSNAPCLNRNDFFSQYHNLASTVGVGDQSKRELNNPPVVVSSRWNPTPEQLRALEELYRRGTRTPSAEQIQQITAQLRRFGKIEGKNVFYWFQNHKARERQKRRRQMESASDQPEFPDTTTLVVEKKDLGASRTVFEVEQQHTTKNWHQPSSTTTTTLPEESVSIQRAAKAVGSEFRTDGWLQFDEGELQQRRNFMERNATWHMMQLTCPTIPTLAPHLINSSTTHPNYNNSNNSNSNNNNNSMATTTVSTRLMDPKLIKTHHDLGLFISPHHQHQHHHTHRENGFFHFSSMISSSHQDDGIGVESQTLQLFPIRNGDGCTDHSTTNQHKETDISASAMNAPSQFIEFLPLKN